MDVEIFPPIGAASLFSGRGEEWNQLIELGEHTRAQERIRALEDMLQEVLQFWHAEGPDSLEACVDTLCVKARALLEAPDAK